jgi:UDP-N-acetylmuramate dehydrogenase
MPPLLPELIAPAVCLAPFTSFKVGGNAEFFTSPRNIEQLSEALDWAKQQQLAITVLGAGSNLLISDRGLPGLVICIRYLRGVSFDPTTGKVWAAAGESIVDLARLVAAQGFSGLEWAIGIPGTVGGVVVMNAGAQGGCTADCLVEAETISKSGQVQILKAGALNYSYRTSNLQNGDRLVTGATLQLQPGYDPSAIAAQTTAYLKHRQATQPYHLPSCGSVFRNPSPHSAGKLIEDTGLKGYQIGMAQVAELHANFILNLGGATASDIFQLISYVQAQVQQKWGIALETEVKSLGMFS